MRPSQLQLEGTFFEEVTVRAHSVAAAERVSPPIVGARRSYVPDATDRNLWQVRLEVDLTIDDGEPTGYTGRVVVRGVFRVDATAEPQMRSFLVTNGAPALLYGAAREMVLTITGRGPHQPVLLPSVIFSPESLPDEPGTEPATLPQAAKARKKPAKPKT